MGKEKKPPRRGLGYALLAVLAALAGSVTSAQPAAPGIPQDSRAQQLRLTRSFDFGAFCVADLQPGNVEVGRGDLSTDGTWRQIVIRVNKADAQKPRIFFLGGMRREDGPYSRCGSQLPPGVRKILDGSIVSGTLRFRIRDEPIADFTRAFEIENKQLDIEIDRVNADFRPLYGGKVAPDGYGFLITNVGRFVVNPGVARDPEDNILTGQLRIRTWRLKLQSAILRLPGATSDLTATFTAGSDGVTLNVDVPTGQPSLQDGYLRATQVNLPSGLFNTGGAEFAVARGHAQTLDLVGQAGKGGPLMELRKLTLSADTITHAGPPVARLTPTEPVMIAEVTGPLLPDQGAAQLVDAKAAGIRVPAAAVAFGGTVERPALAGQGSVMLSLLDATSMAGEVHLAMPDLIAAKDAVPELAAREVSLKLNGKKSALKLEGQIDMMGARLRTLDLANLERAPVNFNGQENGDELGLRFSLDTSAPQGRWSFTDPTGAIVMLEGAIRQLKAAGTLWLGTAAKPARLEVDPNTFRLAANGTVVRHSLVFGAAPGATSLSADVGLRSASGFTLSKAGAEGRMELATNLLAVNDPNLSFTESSQGQFRIHAPLRFDAGAILGLKLTDFAVSLIQGHVAVDQLSAEGLTAAPIKIADLEVTSPKLTMDRLEINVQNEVGIVKGRGLVFEASGLKHAAEPQWEVVAPNPRLPEIEASLGKVNDALVLTGASVRNLDIRATRGSYRSRDGFTVAGEGVAVTAALISESKIDSGRIAITRGNLNLDVSDGGSHTTGSTGFDNFVVTATGLKNDIAGTGQIHLTDLQVDHQFSILKDKCHQDELQLNASLGIGSVDIGLRLEHGDLLGSARVNSPHIHLRKTSHGVCEWNDSFNVDVFEASTSTVCWVPIISEICKEVRKVIKIPVRVPVRFRAVISNLDIPGSADDVDVDLRGSKGVGFCIHHARLNAEGRVQRISVTPTFEAHGDLANLVKSVHDFVWQATLGSLESVIGSSVTNIGSIVTQISPVNHCG